MSRSNAAESGGQSLTLKQSIDARALLPSSLRHGALNLATLGLYGFWARSETRRVLWAETHLNGEPLHYGGSGAELLIGCIFKVLLVGGALAAAAAALWSLGAWGAPVALAAVACAALIVGFSRFAGFIYLATRTEWRGLVFEVDGSSGAAALSELRDWAMNVLTLGWWLPHADRLRAQTLWGGLRHLDRPAAYDAAAAARRPLYSAFAIGWFGTAMIGLFAAGMLLGLAPLPTPKLGAAPSQLAALGALALSIWLGLASVWAPYQAARRTAVAAGLGLWLPLDWRACSRLQLSNVALRIVSLGLLAPYAAARESVFVFSRLEAARRLSKRARAARLSPGVTLASIQTRDEVPAMRAADL
ncbi:hypothetical protein ASE17_09055 [Phenylobacterium sp. Root77]|uniref:DUF898 family protein n=1 Tax=unclassified Phenylobacterium TaxID=2640670 RepID=UPI0006F295A4|nr:MULTISPECIES: DUF898 family protein [unclassified Phenylobacterium]KQW73088.1 hypothetical protein ASC73_01625 [Phenylobacterium sp. Root1277]KQW92307.1 hypothetical protein ASC79_12335 [Phenylobacterium sp. Root1290]KRC40538.1 hypothetical protein ASE17_09055 [Phenylobacterium sp. Root77]